MTDKPTEPLSAEDVRKAIQEAPLYCYYERIAEILNALLASRPSGGGTAWYDFDPDAESAQECRDRRLQQCPILSPVQLEALRQLAAATWDGNLISKVHRDELIQMGLVCRFNGWQIVTKQGLAVLETLGELRP